MANSVFQYLELSFRHLHLRGLSSLDIGLVANRLFSVALNTPVLCLLASSVAEEKPTVLFIVTLCTGSLYLMGSFSLAPWDFVFNFGSQQFDCEVSRVWFSLHVSWLVSVELLGSINLGLSPNLGSVQLLFIQAFFSAPFSPLLLEIQLHIHWNIWYYLTDPWDFLHFSSVFFLSVLWAGYLCRSVFQLSDSSTISRRCWARPLRFPSQLLYFSVLESHVVHFPVKIFWVFFTHF